MLRNVFYMLISAAIWFFVILLLLGFYSCKTSKHLTIDTQTRDTIAVKKKDSTALSNRQKQESDENERIWEMPFGLKDSVDAQGNVVKDPYLSSMKVTDRNKTVKDDYKKDSVHVATVDSTYIKMLQQSLKQKTSTSVFSMWQS